MKKFQYWEIKNETDKNKYNMEYNDKGNYKIKSGRRYLELFNGKLHSEKMTSVDFDLFNLGSKEYFEIRRKAVKEGMEKEAKKVILYFNPLRYEIIK